MGACFNHLKRPLLRKFRKYNSKQRPWSELLLSGRHRLDLDKAWQGIHFMLGDKSILGELVAKNNGAVVFVD